MELFRSVKKIKDLTWGSKIKNKKRETNQTLGRFGKNIHLWEIIHNLISLGSDKRLLLASATALYKHNIPINYNHYG